MSNARRKKAYIPESKPYPQPESELPPSVGEEISVRNRDEIKIKFRVPKGKVANIMGVMNLLQSKFETLGVGFTARDGAISEQDYEDKIKEAFRQIGIRLE